MKNYGFFASFYPLYFANILLLMSGSNLLERLERFDRSVKRDLHFYYTLLIFKSEIGLCLSSLHILPLLKVSILAGKGSRYYARSILDL